MSLLIACIAVLILVPVVLRLKIIDRPNQRSIHLKATPKAGGIAIFFGVLAGLIYSGYGSSHWEFSCLLAGAAALGLVDDLKTLSPGTKMLGQVLLAVLTLAAGYGFNLFGNFLDPVLTVIWIIGFMNAFNLIDGMDGLAAGVGVISTIAFWLLMPGVSGLLWPMTGALLGFLVYNFRPASIFMGDTGSMLIGYYLAVIGLLAQSTADSQILGMVSLALILFYPIFDTFLSIIRRKINHHPILAPDRSHSYNLMVDQLGFSYLRTVFFVYGLSAATGLLGFLTYGKLTLSQGILAFLAVIAFLVFLVLRYKLLAESRLEQGKDSLQR